MNRDRRSELHEPPVRLGRPSNTIARVHRQAAGIASRKPIPLRACLYPFEACLLRAWARRYALYEGKEMCRVDVAAAAEPVWAKTSKSDRVFFVRLNNSTRSMPEDEADTYARSRWTRFR